MVYCVVFVLCMSTDWCSL